MSNKEKWKTQPCKTCLLKRTCKQDCFKYPGNYKIVSEHVKKGTCMGCGNKSISDEPWCIICYKRSWYDGE